ncbi:MAG: hypothetical protein WKG07_40795 [Hymenobacter sp.]
MDSIREYLLIKEDEMRVEHYAKQNAKQWIYRIYNDRDEVDFARINQLQSFADGNLRAYNFRQCRKASRSLSAKNRATN